MRCRDPERRHHIARARRWLTKGVSQPGRSLLALPKMAPRAATHLARGFILKEVAALDLTLGLRTAATQERSCSAFVVLVVRV